MSVQVAASKPRSARNSGAKQRGLYEPLNWGLVRAPLLPVEAYPTATSDAVAAADGRVRAALAVGSGELFAAMSRTQPRDVRRLHGKLLRYLIRMSTRPTPYGLFAGVGLVEWSGSTDVALSSARPQTRTRPDMEWLLGLVSSLERDPDIRRAVRLVANPLALARAGRVFVGDGALSVRATGAVLRALERARQPVTHEELADELAARPGATREKAERLVEQLLAEGALLTDLRPPLTGVSPLAHVRDKLAGIPAAGGTLDGLERLETRFDHWDAMPLEERTAEHPALIDAMRAVRDGSPAAPGVQVDLALALAGRRVHEAVALEAAAAGELLVRLSPYPRGLPHLEAYRHAFEGRYGPGREVELLEMLDPQFGLGPPSGHGGGWDGIDPKRSVRRAQTLRDLALRAYRERLFAVELGDDLLARLETSAPTPDTAPLSLDISLLVVAESTAAIDAGEFLVAVGPNLGASATGRNLGRFCDLLGGDAARAAQQAADADPLGAAGTVAAEIVYMPQRPRSANVAIRPAVRDYEILIGAGPGVPWERVIPVQELVVGVRAGRFYVRWPRGDADVVATQGHMLNGLQAPQAARFLLEASCAHRTQLSSFDWGPAAGFTFLPRVQRGRVVLAPAQWRIDPTELPCGRVDTFLDALAVWRKSWGVPDEVYLTAGDNRLLLDLGQPDHVDLAREELRGLPEGHSILLQEALPRRQDAWLPGPEGQHVTELVVPLILRRSRVSAAAPAPPAVAPPHAVAPPLESVRSRPPGSDWLYLKLYCPRVCEDDLIAEPLRSFGEFALASGLADAWFFLRYADPDPHLRVRFRGRPSALIGPLLEHACGWASELVADGICQRFGFDTYEREVERYGGEAGMSTAEAIFAGDSTAVAEMLWRSREGGVAADRVTLSVLSIDDLLDSLGLSEEERCEWYRGRAQLSRQDGKDFRARQGDLRRLLGRPGALAADPGGVSLAGVLSARRRMLAPAALELQALESRGQLSHPRAELCGSYVHLHCNRLLGASSATEQRALQLLRRAREGLARAPVVARPVITFNDSKTSQRSPKT